MVPYDKSTWDRIRPAVDSALDLAPNERDQFLSALRTTDPELAALVEQFLSSELSHDGSQTEGAPGAAPLPAATAPATLAGMMLGSYVLDRLIGRGGMGQVWLAHRADGRFEGQVAVKLLNLALVGGRAEKRFLREGNILAMLTHPNIARLLDAGISEIGQPFLVLEYIEGTRLDEYCDSRSLSPAERVRLVIEVLDAVSSAHSNLVVHRDLKPANILVTNTGAVKLLDFGIAKLLEVDEEAELTATGGRALTPEYAAPEQVLSGSITTSTDVYAAGILLFRLLAGVHPLADGAKTSAEYFRATIYGSQLRLSDAVTSTKFRTAAEMQRSAAQRGNTGERLAKQFAGDLDNILARALRRESGERYQSIAALADDLRRYLRHGVVSVRADSTWYRLSRFARRNRIGVAAAGIVAAALVGATLFSRQQMRVAEDQRDEAKMNARLAQATGDVLLQLLSLVESDSVHLTPDARLARVQSIVARQYRSEPQIHASILSFLADRYGELNDLMKQSELELQSAALSHSVGDNAAEAHQRCIASWVLFRSERKDSAEAQLALAKQILLRYPRDTSMATSIACSTADATRQVQKGAFDSAVVNMQTAVALTKRSGDTLSSNYTVALNNLANSQMQSGHIREALATLGMAIAAFVNAGNVDTEGYLVLAGNRAASLLLIGEYATASRGLEAEIRRLHAPGSTAPAPLTLLVRSVAAYQRLGAADSVARMAPVVLADSSRSLPPNVILDTKVALADATLLSGRVADAERMAAALGPTIAQLPPRPRARLQPVLLDAALMNAAGKPAAALDSLQRFARSAGWGDTSHVEAWLAPLLIRASSYALATGDAARAATLAHDARGAASIDSLAPKQSAVVGDALVAESRARLALRDTVGASVLVAQSLVPLRYGYGAGHARVTAAEQLLAAIRR